MGQTTVVDVNDLSRSFGSKRALDGVSFHATAGQVHGLVGANGAGKTTLLKHLLGLLRAATGSVRVFGLDPVRDPVGVLSRIGYLSEERELPEWMRVDELMDYTRAFHPTWDASYARELLESFALDPSKKVKELSKGMRAQAGLIAAVAHRPALLILDEPSSGLDAVVRRDILDAIVRTVADDGRTVIFSSHLLDEVERMSDHVTLMHHGRVTLSGALDDVRRDYQRSRVRLRTLLADRFKLKTHTETRELPIYELVLARSDGRLGADMRPSQSDCSNKSDEIAAQQSAALVRGDFASVTGKPSPCAVTTDTSGGPLNLMMRGDGQEMKQIVEMLQMFTGRTVRDKTGLTGRYDFDMKMDIQMVLAMAKRMGANTPAAANIPQADGSSLMTALNEQLGLKLESTRGPLDVLTIDGVEAPVAD